MNMFRLLAIILIQICVCIDASAVSKISEANKEFCSGSIDSFNFILNLDIADPTNLPIYLNALQSDKIVDQILERYSKVNLEGISEPEKVVVASAKARSSLRFPNDVLSILNFKSKSNMVEGLRRALLQSLRIKSPGKTEVENFKDVLSALGYFDPSIFSQMIDADVVAGSRESLAAEYVDKVEGLSDEDPYKLYLLSKLDILRVAKDRATSSDVSLSVFKGFESAYQKCPFNQEFVIVFAQQLIAQKKYLEAKPVLERTISTRKYVSPYVNLFLLVSATELDDRIVFEREAKRVEDRQSWYSQEELLQIKNIKSKHAASEFSFFENLIWLVVVVVLIVFSFMIFRRKSEKQ
ncbi:hypothetical protein DOM22_10920 [Bdellovibrio sp. ZAP7]|uniref:hypothetical protein n=1 Tax=Bdellovibrio sp. ZAP7 TaxID=2231053 RepID=UPI00115A17FA|nr:hypothetical protein [Bdellovibrio sp. ZAP7]QDK45623.1 hypothetical protein DOM22_10920 [Bdellovibrio sp. ZAP7]